MHHFAAHSTSALQSCYAAGIWQYEMLALIKQQTAVQDSRSCSDDDSDGSINLAFSLYVQWRTHSGKTRSERASLQPVDSLADLQVHANLLRFY